MALNFLLSLSIIKSLLVLESSAWGGRQHMAQIPGTLEGFASGGVMAQGMPFPACRMQ